MKENSPLMKTERDQRFNSDYEREAQKESQCKGLLGYLACLKILWICFLVSVLNYIVTYVIPG